MKPKETKVGSKIPATNRNKTIIGIICIAAALLIGFVITPLVANHTAKAAVTQAAKETQSVKTNNTANGFKLSDGQYLISVSTKNFCDSVSGKLRSGDIVTVFIPPVAVQNAVTTSSTSTLSADNPPELQYVKVIAVTTASGQDTDNISSSSASTNNNQPATVTLLVNVKQAAILAGTEQNTVHFALAYRGGGAKAEELLKRQSAYFETNSSTTSSADQTSSSAQASSSAQTSSSENTNTVEVTK